MSKRFGLLGGAFDPIHLGHLILASETKRQFQLDRIIFIPTFVSAHKHKAIVASYEHRFAMVKLAISGQKDFVVSDIESRADGPSYSVNTLKLLQADDPEASYFFVIGADGLAQMDTWREPEKILQLATLIVAPRPGFRTASHRKYGPFQTVDMPLIGISASDLRRRVKEDSSIRYLVPESVEAYMRDNRLYRD